MGGSQKSKRVRWPSDDNLCQVRLFLSEESPVQVGFGSQDHLQAKTLGTLNSNSLVFDDNLPPGFEGAQPANLPWNKLPQIPLIKWKCPARFLLDDTWRVVAGEESREVKDETEREKRILEAIYPRPSAIPPDPSTAMGIEDSLPSYQQSPPTIPIIPIEDEDTPAPADALFDSVAMNTLPMNLQAQPVAPGVSSSGYSLTTQSLAQGVPATEAIPGVDPDAVAAVHASLTAVMMNNNQENLIDRDLLIKILSDPKMVEQLVKNHGASTSTQIMPATSMQNVPTTSMQNMTLISTQSMAAASMQNMPTAKISNMASTTTLTMAGTSLQNGPRPIAPGISLSDPSPISINRTDRPLAHISRPEELLPPVATTSSGVFYPPSRISPIPGMRPPVPDVASVPLPYVGAPVTKDINYYKSLIQQHGGESQETVPHFGSHNNHHLISVREPSNNPKSRDLRDLKPKIMKPCMYFNSSRGCRNGANCAYQHDESSKQRVSSIQDSQNPKRMKMDREITGT